MHRLQLKRVLPITALVLLTGAHIPSNALSEELSVRVRTIANAAIKSGSDVGISIGVAQGDEVLLAEGYGLADVESDTPASSTTVYRIGSITKQFTAAAILQIVEREKLSLDDPLTKHLSNHPAHDPPVTLRHLLQHTSGMKSFTSLPTYRQLKRAVAIP